MTAQTATIELGRVWRFSEAVSPSARADLFARAPGPLPNICQLGGDTWALTNAVARRGPSFDFFSDPAIAARAARTEGNFETFPSVVEITWYRPRFTLSSNQAAFLTGPGLTGEGPIGRSALVAQEFSVFTPQMPALTCGLASLSLSLVPQTTQSGYALACMNNVVGAWADFITNYLFQMNRATVPTPLNCNVLSFSSAAVESIAPSDDCVVQISDPVHSPLAKKIRAVYESTRLDQDDAESARRAVNDAIKFVDFNLPGREPLVMLSDDGVLSLQWRLGNWGVLLVFTGDGTGTYSIKQPGGSYAIGAKDFSLEHGLVEEVRAAIDARAVA